MPRALLESAPRSGGLAFALRPTATNSFYPLDTVMSSRAAPPDGADPRTLRDGRCACTAVLLMAITTYTQRAHPSGVGSLEHRFTHTQRKVSN
jgi:hypothetical protein